MIFTRQTYKQKGTIKKRTPKKEVKRHLEENHQRF